MSAVSRPACMAWTMASPPNWPRKSRDSEEKYADRSEATG